MFDCNRSSLAGLYCNCSVICGHIIVIIYYAGLSIGERKAEGDMYTGSQRPSAGWRAQPVVPATTPGRWHGRKWICEPCQRDRCEKPETGPLRRLCGVGAGLFLQQQQPASPGCLPDPRCQGVTQGRASPADPCAGGLRMRRAGGCCDCSEAGDLWPQASATLHPSVTLWGPSRDLHEILQVGKQVAFPFYRRGGRPRGST